MTSAYVAPAEGKQLLDAEKIINQELDKIEAAVKARRQELLGDVKQLGKARLHPIESERESLVMCLSQAGAVCEEVNHAMERGDLGMLAAKQSIDTRLASLKTSTAACLAQKVQLVGTPVLFSPSLLAAIAAHGSVGAPPAPRIVTSECKSTPSSLIVSWESKFAAVGTPVFSVELRPANAGNGDKADVMDENKAAATFVEAYRGSELKAE